MFKLDMKLIYKLNNAEYIFGAGEFAPFAGNKKAVHDRSKLLVEGKIIIDNLKNMFRTDEDLKTMNIQVMGVDLNLLSVKKVKTYLYVGSSLGSLVLPSSVSSLSTEAVGLIDFLETYKKAVSDTVHKIQDRIVGEKKEEKTIKRKIEGDGQQKEPRKKVVSWRYNKKSNH